MLTFWSQEVTGNIQNKTYPNVEALYAIARLTLTQMLKLCMQLLGFQAAVNIVRIIRPWSTVVKQCLAIFSVGETIGKVSANSL